jgi:hypothetical protein
MGAHRRGRKGKRGEGELQGRSYGEEEGRAGRAQWGARRRGIGPLLLLVLSVRDEEGKKREKQRKRKEKMEIFLNLEILGEKNKR